MRKKGNLTHYGVSFIDLRTLLLWKQKQTKEQRSKGGADENASGYQGNYHIFKEWSIGVLVGNFEKYL